MMPFLALAALARCYARLRSKLSAERGQTLAEYSLLLTLVAVGVTVTAIIVFRTALAAGFDAMTTCLLNGC